MRRNPRPTRGLSRQEKKINNNNNNFVRLRSLRRADHSSRGVPPTVMCRCVWSRNHKIPREWGGTQGPLRGYRAKRKKINNNNNNVVRLRSLRRADHSSRGVLPTVVCRCVWSRNHKKSSWMRRNPRPTRGLSRQEKKINNNDNNNNNNNIDPASPGSAANKPSYTHITKWFHTCLWYRVLK